MVGITRSKVDIVWQILLNGTWLPWLNTNPSLQRETCTTADVVAMGPPGISSWKTGGRWYCHSSSPGRRHSALAPFGWDEDSMRFFGHITLTKWNVIMWNEQPLLGNSGYVGFGLILNWLIIIAIGMISCEQFVRWLPSFEYVSNQVAIALVYVCVCGISMSVLGWSRMFLFCSYNSIMIGQKLREHRSGQNKSHNKRDFAVKTRLFSDQMLYQNIANQSLPLQKKRVSIANQHTIRFSIKRDLMTAMDQIISSIKKPRSSIHFG